ncbi:MAG: hypothetical protein P0Y53_12425 [Candidatus Pseudobacter hemicellulosilyticus]|uniref:YD repeat-containing protein n=1 Tax=Candidatus Pseudobacter hemicellulosilyticus TaxID=3121375 RepID=A0AAJ5WVP8_9BACT|nr:MAG: hypothetical protein P0Y53_12425 [Pseudobacter sp.]
MKRLVTCALAAAIAAAMLSLASCRKLHDYPYRSLPGGDSLCRITEITSYGYATADTSTYYFIYNVLGNPDTVRPALSLRSVLPTYVFRYDASNLLISLLEITYYDSSVSPNYYDGIVSNYQSFSYSGSQVAYSSMLFYGVVYNGVLIFNQPVVSYQYGYEYDSLGRITRVQNYLPFTPPYYTNYAYNTQGNLSSYGVNDNKLNLFRTNGIWQFLTRDYSNNNPLSGASYNEFLLPVNTVQPTGRAFLSSRFSVDHARIRYECNCNTKSHN